MADLLSFVKKYKMAAATIMNCYLVTLDHPLSLLQGQKSVLKFHVNCFSTFGDMAIWKFCKFGLKCLFPPQKIFVFWGVLTPKHISSSRPPKGTSLAETAHFEPLSVAIGPAGSPAQRAKNTKKGSPERSPEKRGIGPAHALNPILTIFGMWGGTLDVFLKFELRVGRSPNFGAMGGQKSPFSYSTHIAYTTACCYRTSCDDKCKKL